MIIKQIDPPLPVISPKGKGFAHFIIDYGIEHFLYFVCFQDDTGECWTWCNKEVRLQNNTTLGRGIQAKMTLKPESER